ncbi:MAG: GtrA family protein [Alphaproteobacteria bacterium]|nr:GtrA family protein [Alphaproteobacteria bacterium]
MHSQLFRFCVVGALAFVVDAGVVQALVVWGQWNPYLARLVSYLSAASTAWWLNRRFTFGAGDDPLHREWAKYLVVNTAGGLVNYATYAALVLASDLVRAMPALGVAAGSVAGLVVNFSLNRWLVFRRGA